MAFDIEYDLILLSKSPSCGSPVLSPALSFFPSSSHASPQLLPHTHHVTTGYRDTRLHVRLAKTCASAACVQCVWHSSLLPISICDPHPRASPMCSPRHVSVRHRRLPVLQQLSRRQNGSERLGFVLIHVPVLEANSGHITRICRGRVASSITRVRVHRAHRRQSQTAIADGKGQLNAQAIELRRYQEHDGHGQQSAIELGWPGRLVVSIYVVRHHRPSTRSKCQH